MIPSATRLSAALRYFASGSVYDIILFHNILYIEIFKNIWIVIDTINSTDIFKIKFPVDHDKQKKIADGFKNNSKIDFSNIVKYINKIFLWTE